MANGIFNARRAFNSPAKESVSKLSMLAALKRNVSEAVSDVLKRTVLLVRVQNQKDYSSQLKKLNSTLLQATDVLKSEIEKSSSRSVSVDTLKEVKETFKDATPDYDEVSKSLRDVGRAIADLEFPTLSNAEVVSEIKKLQTILNSLPSKLPKPEKVNIPKPEKIEFPKSFSMQEAGNILKALQDVKSSLDKLPRAYPKQRQVKIDLEPLMERVAAVEGAISSLRFPEMEFPQSISVDNFPPQKVPTPVTSVWINSLRGPILSTQVDVGSSATQIPASNLSQRRSMIVFNNDSSKTVFIGDENVNTEDGMPVFPKQFSPSLDVGDIVDVYAITTSGTVDVRILETSMDQQGA